MFHLKNVSHNMVCKEAGTRPACGENHITIYRVAAVAHLVRLDLGSTLTFDGAGVFGSLSFSASFAFFLSMLLMWPINGLSYGG